MEPSSGVCSPTPNGSGKTFFSLKNPYRIFRSISAPGSFSTGIISAKAASSATVECRKPWHLEIGMEFFLRFLHEWGGFADDWRRGIFERIQSILTRLARNQSDSIDEDKPTHVVIHKLFSLLESEKVCFLKKNEIHDFVPQHCIGYEDER